MKKYIENKIENGVEYDFKEINKEFRKLKIPGDVYNPIYCPFEKAKWFVELSERSTGKTTNFLLYGMTMNKMYGTTIQYIRQKEMMIAPKNSKDIFKTILQYDYVEKITDGKYNSITYNSRRWYYCKTDENGDIVETANEHFMFMLSIDNAEQYKSSYNAPLGDFIIFDEFIGKFYQTNEFVNFNDLVKTIIRDRQSPIIIMLANTIDKNSIYFNELEIYDKIQLMHQGENEIITSDKGTKIYVEILESSQKKNKKRNKVNELFFGWKNPLINSITGDDWSLSNYPHIPKNLNQKLFHVKHYIEFNNKLVRIDLVKDDTLGIYCCLHYATKLYDDSIIYTINDIKDSRYRFKFGFTDFDKKIWQLYVRNKFYYATNDIGTFIETYVKQAKQLVR